MRAYTDSQPKPHPNFRAREESQGCLLAKNPEIQPEFKPGVRCSYNMSYYSSLTEPDSPAHEKQEWEPVRV